MAGALSKRDIEMIFRAETDGATRDINTLKSSVADLRKQLQDQTKAVERGDGSLDELAKTTRDLKKAQDELGSARSLLTSLNNQEKRAEGAADKLSKLEAEYADLAAAMKAAEKPTKTLTNRFESKGRAVDAARDKLAQENTALAETKAQIEGIIGPVNNFEQAFRDIATTSKEASRGLAIAGDAADTLKAKLAAAQQGGVSDQAFADMAARSAVSPQAISLIEGYENRVQLLKLEEAALEAQRKGDAAAERARKQQQIDDIDRLLAGNKTLEAEIAQLAVESERVAKINAFTRIAHDARLAAGDVGKVQSTFTSTAATASRLGDAIREIVAPAQAAADDLNRVGVAIDNAEKALSSKKPLRLAEYQTALNEVERSIAGLQRAAGQIDGLRTQEAAVDRANRAWTEARQRVDDLASKMIQAGTEGGQFTNELKQAEGAAERAAKALQDENTRLDALRDKAAKAGIEVNDLAATEAKLTAEATRAATAQQALASKTGRGGAGKGIFGLNPQELQLLSFQINDVITSLASGISPMQTLAQQGGQIYQIFPAAFASIAAYLPVIIPLAIALGVAFASVSKQLDEIARKKSAEALLSSLGETSGYTADKIVEAENTLKSFGASTEEAQKAVETFVREGINPEALDPFIIAAQNMADVTGKTVPEAADLMTKAFTGSKDEVLALDDQFHFLSDAERDHIRDMDESTQQSEIRRYAFEKFYEKMQAGADNMNGPWKQATDTWRVAWNSLLDEIGLGQTTITDTINYISEAILGVTRLINIIKEINSRTKSSNPLGSIASLFTLDYGDAIATADAKTRAQYQASQKRFQQPLAAPVDPGAGSRGAQRQKEDKQDKDRKQAAKDAKKAARDAEAARKKAERDAEQLQRQYESSIDSLQGGLDRMTAQALRRQSSTVEQEIANARDAVDKQYNSLYDQLAEFEKKFPGKKINGLTAAEYRAQLDQNKAILKDAAQLKVYEENINDLVTERGRRLKAIQDQVDSGEITPQEGFQKTLEVTSELNPKIAALAELSRQFANSLQGAADSPEIKAFLAKLDDVTRSTGQTNPLARQAGAQERDIADTRVNQIVQQRNALIAAQNALVEAGVISQTDAQKRIEQAYTDTTPKILDQVAAYRALIEAQLAAKLIDPIDAQAILAQLDLVVAQTQYVADNIKQVNQAAQQAFGEGVTSLVNGFAQSLAGLLTGTMSVGDALANIGNLALSFAAQWLKAIADVLVQMLALQAVKAVLGGGFGGGIGGLIFHSGTESVGSYAKGTRSRTSLNRLSPALLDVIPRYHNGSAGVGLQPDEQLSILQKGEKVLTEEQQRREAAGQGSGSAGKIGLRQVLAFGDDEVAGAMAGPAGEEVTVTHIRRNKTLIRQELGID